MLFLYSHECVSEGWGYWWLLTDIYLLHPRKLSVVGSSVLQLYLHTKGDNSLKIPLSFVAGQSLNLK